MTEIGLAAPVGSSRVDRRRVRSALGLGLGLLGTRANLAVSGLLLTLLVSSRVSSAVAVTFALGANRFVGWIAYPLLGRASDRHHGRAGRRAPFMVASLVIMGTGTYAYPSVPGYWALVALIVCVKLAYVVSGIGGLTVIPETFGKSRSVKALALVAGLAAAVSFGIKGTVFATWRTGDPGTWAPAFHVAGVIMLVSAVAVLMLVRESRAAQAVAQRQRTQNPVSWRRELAQTLAGRNARLLAVGVALFWAGISATSYLAFVYFEKVQHAGAGAQTVAGWAAGVPSVVVGIIGGYGLSRLFTRKQVAVLTPAAGAVISLLQFESTHIWQTVALAIVGAPLFSAFAISMAPMLLALLPRSGGAAELLGKLVAPFSAAGLLFAFVAAWAVDSSGDYRVIWLFPAAAGVAQAAVMCGLRIDPEARRPRIEGLGERLVVWAVSQFEDRGHRLFGGTVTESDADASSLFETARNLLVDPPSTEASLVCPTQSHDRVAGMASEEITRLSAALRPSAASLLDVSVDGQRRLWEAIGTAYPLPDGTEVVATIVGGVPAERVTAPGADSQRAVLHFHGGGYAIGSCSTHRELAARLSAACKSPVVVPDYRLAPEHPFPAAFDDAWSAFAALRDELGPRSLVLSGDSAGGGLALAVAQQAARQGQAAGQRLVLWSPWVDLVVSDEDEADAVLTPAWLRWCASAYLDGARADDPRASPIHGSFAGLPATLVLVARHELLHGQARRVMAGLETGGVPAELVPFDHDVHLWMLLGPSTPEAAASVARAGAFVAGGWGKGEVP